MTNVLVTGGAGFIGSALVRRLLHDGYAVRVMDDYSRGVPRRLHDISQQVDMCQGDVRDAQQVDDAVRGMDIVLHLAAVNGTENFYKYPDRVLEVGVKGTLHTMDAAIKHGCKRYVLASSSEVYQAPTHVPTTEQERIIIPDITNPRFSYSGGKIVGELLAFHYLQRRGIDTLVFRPHNIYGPDMGNEHVVPQFIARLLDLKKKEPTGVVPFPIQGDGSQTRAFCHVEDCVNAIMLIVEKGRPNELYHIGTEREVTIGEVARILATSMGLDIAIETGDISPIGGTPRRCPSIVKMRELGYAPSIDLEEGLHRTAVEEVQRLRSAA